MKKIRLGIIGIGNMGSGHACRVVDGEYNAPDFMKRHMNPTCRIKSLIFSLTQPLVDKSPNDSVLFFSE